MRPKIIDADKKHLFTDFAELYRYRDLFMTLAWRDFRIRYAQTIIGFAWVILQPLITLVILSLVFGKLVGVQTAVPHILYTAAGIAIWSYFSFVMTNSGNSIIASQGMIKKIYFPRLIVPLSKAMVGLIDLGVALVILACLMIYYGIYPSPNIWFAFVFIIIGMLSALGMGIWFSALTVRYRDFQHVVPFIVQIGLYITPIAYPASYATKFLPKWAATLYYLNPMAGVVQGFRWALFGEQAPENLFWISLLIVLIIFISGLMYFRRVQDDMADYV